MQKYQKLKELRKDRNLSQIEIAEILGTTQRQYSRWETGSFQIPFNIIIELAKFYNVSIDYIAGLTNDKRKKMVKTIKRQKKKNNLCRDLPETPTYYNRL